MSLSSVCIHRPIATSLLMLAVLLLGVLGYRQLPISTLPNMAAPTLVVTTRYPGASAATVAQLVTTPLERELGQISGMDAISSNSSTGLSSIVLRFNRHHDIDIAAQDVQSALHAARLPGSLPYPPSYHRVNPADAPILTLAITSRTQPLRALTRYADAILAQKLSQVEGVGLVSIAGDVRPAVRIEVNPAKLGQMGLTMEDVRRALTQANVNAAKGSLNGATRSYAINTNDQLTSKSDYGHTIIREQNGAPVYLDDVATITNGVENNQQSAHANGQQAVLLDIRRQPGANIVNTVDHIKQVIPQLRQLLPASVKLDVFSDRTVTIRASVHDVQRTLLLTILLVIAVMFVFLRRLWATLIPSVAIPLSLMGTFAVMSAFGMSLDNLSLMALTVATGFVVDDAIVMIENIVRYLEKGKTSIAAAKTGAREIGFTVVSLTVSLVAVFLPLLLMPGITGLLFHEFAWVLSIAVIISMGVSLTLTPMMCAYLLKPDKLPESDKDPTLHQGKRSGWQGLVKLYAHSLDWALAHKLTIAVLATIAMVATLWLYMAIPKGLLPEQDTGLVTAVVEANDNIAFAAMEKRMQKVAKAVRNDPAVTGVAQFVGTGSINPRINQGQLSIVLASRANRPGLKKVLARLRHATKAIPGVAVYFKPVQDMTLDSHVSATEYQYVLSSTDPDELAQAAQETTTHMRHLPALADVSNNLAAKGDALHLQINRDQASHLGVPIQTIDDTLYDAFGQRQISTIFTDLNQYRVILEVASAFRNKHALMNLLPVRSNGNGTLTGANATGYGMLTSSNSSTNTGIGQSNTGILTGEGHTVPLSALANVTHTQTPLVISHQDQLPAITISFNLAPGYALSEAMTQIEHMQAKHALPSRVQAQFIGKAAQFSASTGEEIGLLLAAIAIIYIVLGVLYESYIHPLTILSTLPPAGLGALLALMLFHLDLSVDGIVGIVLLIGIVKKNAILMVDFAISAQRAGKSAHEAIRQACLLRFRPILMTTLAALFSALPLALGTGIGAELRRPLGVAIVGGLLLSQLVTLYTTPVIYLYMEKLSPQHAKPAPALTPPDNHTLET